MPITPTAHMRSGPPITARPGALGTPRATRHVTAQYHPSRMPHISIDRVCNYQTRSVARLCSACRFTHTPSRQMNECQVAALSNGSLLMVGRSEAADRSLNRVSSVSRDRGLSWSPLRVERTLAGFATCEGSLMAHRGALFFSHPQNPAGVRGVGREGVTCDCGLDCTRNRF